MDHSKPRILTTEQAAEYLGHLFSKGTLEQLRCRGGGPPFRRRGRRVFYLADDLDAWLRESGPFTSTSQYGTEQPGGEAA